MVARTRQVDQTLSMSLRASLVIRGGTIVDGTGSQPFVGDIAIDGDKICGIGPHLQVSGSTEEINAHGLLVAPGWIDVHTHYDAQATWDSLLTPSAHCGVTTAIMGNCGVGFAPCQKELRPFLLELMEAVEDIPGSALHEGIQWEWETFPEYMDALAKRQYGCDVAVMIGHGGVRTWVMGKRANLSDMPGGPEKNPVSDEEIEAMAAVVREAVAAGALGFSTSRLLLHRDNRGILTPGCLAAKKEMLRICDAVADGGGGIYEMSTDFACYDDVPYDKMDEEKKEAFARSELSWMAEAMQKHDNLRVSFGIGPDTVPFFSKWSAKVSRWPGQCVVQYQTRPQSLHMSHASRINPFQPSPTYQKIRDEVNGDAARIIEMLRNKDTRAAIMADFVGFKGNGKPGMLGGEWYVNDKGVSIPGWMITGDLVFPWTDTYEPAEDVMVSAIAKRTGRTALDVCYDYLLDTQSPHAGILWRPLFGYKGNNDNIYEAFNYENAIPGFDDAGAHCTILTDATSATSSLSHFCRDRARGTVPYERVIKTQTGDAATLFGLNDRGLLKVGKRADINIMNARKLKVLTPYWANDLPTNAGRWMQYAEGYHTTILRGVVTFRNGRHTGELPGRLVRNPSSIGLEKASAKVEAAVGNEDVDDRDLSQYATELSKGGGASAFARVARDQEHRSKM